MAAVLGAFLLGLLLFVFSPIYLYGLFGERPELEEPMRELFREQFGDRPLILALWLYLLKQIWNWLLWGKLEEID